MRLAIQLLLVQLFAACASHAPRPWKTIDALPFTFQVPGEMRGVPGQGIDSYRAEFRSRNIELSFDYGWHSDDLSSWPASTSFQRTVIDGRRAKIGTVAHNFGHRFPYTTSVYLGNVHRTSSSDPNEPTHLNMFASCRTPADCLTAERIFRSLHFKPEPR